MNLQRTRKAKAIAKAEDAAKARGFVVASASLLLLGGLLLLISP